jgi:hypothetical protein
MKKNKIINVLIVLAVIFIAIQFIRPSTDNPPVDPAKDFVNIEKAPENIRVMLKNSCYDCHTFETVYPWYNMVSPVSWYLKKHINEGRKDFNLSTWADFPVNRKSRRLKGAAGMVRNGKMPLWDYKLFHPASHLDEQQKEELASWFEKQAANYPAPPKQNNNQPPEHEHD